MRKCPHCQDTEHQVKAGRTSAGTQLYKCKLCVRRYVFQSRRYSQEMRAKAVQYYADGLSYRKVARHFGVHHVTIMNWVKAHVDQLPPAPSPPKEPLHIVEMDELHTFVGRKNRWYYSDLLSSYGSVVYYLGKHRPMPNKSETYRVEGVNAELRHYLSRLQRRSRFK